jgi:4-aminobutyrate aminotransferase-like enzyme
VLAGAYHGSTITAVELSPYKHDGPGGEGRAAWIHVAPQPDVYRGEWKRSQDDAGTRYAASVQTIVSELNIRGEQPGAFIAETCPSVGGQIIPPSDYFRAAYKHVRDAGGVCIADEVQTGFGRMGTHYWAFEAFDVVPDIVVLGKPIGNGYPLGAVVTTRAIATAFDNGMEFFSTFGGSTASCAAGLAVLDVVRDESLQSHALNVGAQLGNALHSLLERHELVGDVRGSGLFWGVELVRDRGTLEPATAEAAAVAELMRECGVLIGTDGPFHNVLKIRPPMPFSASDSDELVEKLDRVLGAMWV